MHQVTRREGPSEPPSLYFNLRGLRRRWTYSVPLSSFASRYLQTFFLFTFILADTGLVGDSIILFTGKVQET